MAGDRETPGHGVFSMHHHRERKSIREGWNAWLTLAPPVHHSARRRRQHRLFV